MNVFRNEKEKTNLQILMKIHEYLLSAIKKVDSRESLSEKYLDDIILFKNEENMQKFITKICDLPVKTTLLKPKNNIYYIHVQDIFLSMSFKSSSEG